VKKYLIILCFWSLSAGAQTDSIRAIQEINSFQQELDNEYRDLKKSPLSPEEQKKFNGHLFFSVNLKYRVIAKFNRTSDSPFLPMKTSGARLPNYRVYALAQFELDGKKFTVPIYQLQDLMVKPEYVDYLFLPFTDLTNGDESYDAGRYIGLRIPKGDEIIIDFNQAYNPYCAYSDKYNCPLVPPENNLDVFVRAGVKYKK